MDQTGSSGYLFWGSGGERFKLSLPAMNSSVLFEVLLLFFFVIISILLLLKKNFLGKEELWT